MINITSSGGHTAYGHKEFMIDTVADLDDLPINIPMGSVAFCIATSDVYMLNGSREWVKI